MKKQKIKAKSPKQKQVAVIPMKKEMKAKAFEIAANLRGAKITAEIEVMGRNVSNALSDADRRGFELAVLVGPEEEKQGKTILRNMRKREQRTVETKELIEEIMRAK